MQGILNAVFLLVRLDVGLAEAKLRGFLENSDVDYLVGIAKNKVLVRRGRRLMIRARRLSRFMNTTANVFGETRYAAGTWKKIKRRVLIKAGGGPRRRQATEG